MKKHPYVPFILTAAALWGVIGIFLRILTALGFSSLQSVAIRTVGAAIQMGMFLLLWRPGLLRIDWRDLWMFCGTGIASLLFFNWCYFGAIQASNLSVAVVLLYTSPIFVALLSAVCFHERLTRRKVFALTLTFAGCLLVTGIATGSGTISRRGVLLGLGAGFGYALYSIFGRVALRKYHTLTITAWTFLMAAAASIPLALADTPCDWSALLTPAGLIGTIGISLVCCTLPYLLYTLGLSGVETGRAAILATIEPAVATLVGIVCFDERMTATKLAGMALIFGAIVLLSQPVRIKNQSKG